MKPKILMGIVALTIVIWTISSYLAEKPQSTANSTANETISQATPPTGIPSSIERPSPPSMKEQILKAEKNMAVEQTGDVRFGEYYDLLKDKRYESAEEVLKEILQEDPNNEVALQKLGRLYLRYLKDPTKALDPLRKVATQHPDNHGALSDLMRAYEITGKSNDGEKFLTQLVHANPQAAGASEVLGNMYASQGRLSEAVPHLERAAKNSKYPEFALGSLADAYSHNGQPNKAVESYEKILSLYEKKVGNTDWEEVSEDVRMEMEMTRFSLISSLIDARNFEQAEGHLALLEKHMGDHSSIQSLRDRLESARSE